jgi:hypothetical protein
MDVFRCIHFKNNGKYKVRFTVMNTDGKELKSTEVDNF